MMPWLADHVGNASSVQHPFGRRAATAIEAARTQVADLLSAQPREIVFTSGATEANNLAIKGVAEAAGRIGHIVTCVTEHPAVLEPIRHLEAGGWSVTYLAVNSAGELDLAELARSVTSDTVLVSIMAANNEIGTLHPLGEISQIAHAHGALVHSDAAQAVGKIDLDVEGLDVDLVSLSGHKLYGPPGIGALYVRRDVGGRLAAQLHGGRQEGGRRSGSSNTPGCVGLGEACHLASEELADDQKRVGELRDAFLSLLSAGAPDVDLNGPPLERRLPGTVHVTFSGAEADAVMANCPEVAMAAGSACSSAAPAPSHVLSAIGLSPELAECSLRISFGRFTTRQEVDQASALILAAVARVRNLVGSAARADRLATV
jgi:cysteine desulfurase